MPDEPVDADLDALADELRRVYVRRDEELRRRWDRSLPFGDAVFDRWERAQSLGFGQGSSIYNSSMVLGEVSVGEHTWIGPNTLLDGSGGGLSIGAWCSVSAGVHLYTHDTVLWSLSMGALDRATGSVSVGDGTHLGAQCIVVAGVSIGSRCVVGANSFVDRDVPDRAIVVGSPARRIGTVRGEGSSVELVIGAVPDDEPIVEDASGEGDDVRAPSPTMSASAGSADGGVSIALFGNVANALFDIARALRTEPTFDVHLYVSSSDTARPEGADPAAVDADWIHRGAWITPSAVLTPWRAPITRELAQYDLVIVSGPGPVFAQWCGRPYCWFVTGGDLTVKPFPFTFWSHYPTFRHRVGEVVAGFWQRRSARRATEVWIQPFAPMVDAARRLRIPQSRISAEYFPLVIDIDEFRPGRPFEKPDDPTVQRMKASDLAVLHPSRLVMKDTPKQRRSGQLKANDVLIRGFARFVQSGSASDPLLVMPDSSMSADLDEAKALVRELGITEQVLWARPPTPTGFSRHDLLDLYSAADVVAVDFGIGWFGYVALEGLAVGVPVVTHIDHAVVDTMYDEAPPFCSASDAEQVEQTLQELARDEPLRARIGQRGREWVVAHHSADRAGARYLGAIRGVIARHATEVQRRSA